MVVRWALIPRDALSELTGRALCKRNVQAHTAVNWKNVCIPQIQSLCSIHWLFKKHDSVKNNSVHPNKMCFVLMWEICLTFQSFPFEGKYVAFFYFPCCEMFQSMLASYESLQSVVISAIIQKQSLNFFESPWFCGPYWETVSCSVFCCCCFKDRPRRSSLEVD